MTFAVKAAPKSILPANFPTRQSPKQFYLRMAAIDNNTKTAFARLYISNAKAGTEGGRYTEPEFIFRPIVGRPDCSGNTVYAGGITADQTPYRISVAEDGRRSLPTGAIPIPAFIYNANNILPISSAVVARVLPASCLPMLLMYR